METHKIFKIFIADDDNFSLALYEQHLRNLGHNDIHLFSNGAEVLERLSESPDIILLDFFMDRPDGLTVLKEIKCCNPDIYVIMVSGQESVQVAVDAVKFGAFDYVIKGENDLKRIEDILTKIKQVGEHLKSNKKNFFRRFFTIDPLL